MPASLCNGMATQLSVCRRRRPCANLLWCADWLAVDEG
jgi:hypothetical protein